jgi:Flp pilus assembly pilin Flp
VARSPKLMNGSEAPEPVTPWERCWQRMTPTSVVRHVKELAGRIRSEDGQALVEYALLIALIALAAFVAAQIFGLGVSRLYSRIDAVVK